MLPTLENDREVIGHTEKIHTWDWGGGRSYYHRRIDTCS